jgi:NAD(P)H-dependent flavin oxidoreductase YrpB (nitropropane dioxygenase family)
MKTRMTQLLGIKYPIMCGGMMRLAVPKLCAAISNAGALGNLTAANFPSEEDFRNAIRETKSLTKNPFCVNVTMLPALNVGEDHYKMFFRTVAEEKVAAMEIGGTPLDRFAGGESMKVLKDAGVKLIHKVGSIRHAKHCEESGYDEIIAAGVEEGGHPLNDNVTTMVLSQKMAEVLKIPVISAGGTCTGRSLAAALCLGAEGIMFASRFICTPECNVHDNVRQEIIRRQETDTVLYGNSIGLQGRALRNETMKKVVAIESETCDRDEKFSKIIPLIAGTLGPEIWEQGKMDVGSINVGQSIGLIHKVMPCKDMIEEIVGEARAMIQKGSKALLD